MVSLHPVWTFQFCPVCPVPPLCPLERPVLSSCWPPFRCRGAAVGSSQQLSLPQAEWGLILQPFQGQCSSPGHVRGSLLTPVYHHLFWGSKTEHDTLDGVQWVLRKEGMITFSHLPTLHLIIQPRMLLALFAARADCWLMPSSLCQDAQGLLSKAAPSGQIPAGTTAGGSSFPGAGPCTCCCWLLQGSCQHIAPASPSSLRQQPFPQA